MSMSKHPKKPLQQSQENQPSTEPSAPSGSRNDVRASLRGKSFDQQEALLKPSGDAPGKDSGPVQMKMSEMSPNQIEQTIGEGSPLNSQVSSKVGAAYGHDLGNVRVHTDSNVQRMVSQEQAKAVTVGNNIMFAGGQYKPNTMSGDALLAHELAHVVQQSGGEKLAQAKKIAPESTSMEKDADGAVVGAMVQMHGGGMLKKAVTPKGPTLRSGLSFQRCAGDKEPQVGREELLAASQYPDQQMVDEIFQAVFKEDPPAAASQRDVEQMAAEMMYNMIQGSRAMDYVPRPPGRPTPGWLFGQILKGGWRIYQDKGIYNLAVTGTATRFSAARRDLKSGLPYTSPMWD